MTPPYERLAEAVVRRLAVEARIAIPEEMMRKIIREAAMETWVEVRESR